MPNEYAPLNDGRAGPEDDADGLELESAKPTGADRGDVRILSREERKRLWWKDALINSLFIASWFIFATILSVYNKARWMFSPNHFNFPFPLFVTTFHMVVQFILASVARALFPRLFVPTRRPTLRDYGKKAVPCGVTTSLDIGFSNLSLKTITLSFYTMCKSSSLVFVLGFAFLFHLEKFSLRLILVILLITSGVVLMVATETHFVLSGMILVFLASALGGLRWALTQMLLQKKGMGMDNPCATVFWLAPIMGVSLAMLCGVVEGFGNVFGSAFFDGFRASLRTGLYVLAPGAIAFFMVLSEFYIIQRTGIVPMSIAGIFKEVTTIVLSTWVFGDQLTPINITGVAITICGIALFTFHKYRKSIDSPIPLDAHGNPIEPDSLEGEESQPLTERRSYTDQAFEVRRPSVLLSTFLMYLGPLLVRSLRLVRG
ncbi:hypothetical protein BOTBODRAFT_121435 [Botryobasidium botryosum FD-172 SS1]|uniref:Sugar phosphate transporter domain-containing protein n=1 Tax=Botryobasidium botryosum (strain FD-172 SS1) TaxID=930990 RepID=A0A067LW18_BOTB1|nr:hypothetical protein BOTBODRAFT_121435 [Botryobasidium botryosum FD-172 SS1]